MKTKTKKEGYWKNLHKRLSAEWTSMIETRFLFMYGLLFIVGGILSLMVMLMFWFVIVLSVAVSPQLMSSCDAINSINNPVASFMLTNCPVLMIILGMIFLTWAWGDKHPLSAKKVKTK